MAIEIEALGLNNTWTLVDLRADKSTIGCRWVYKIKYQSDGSIERYKVVSWLKATRSKRELISLIPSLPL